MQELQAILRAGLDKNPSIDWDKETDESLLAIRKALDLGKPRAVRKYIEAVLARSEYPASFPRQYAVNYETASETVVVDILLPVPEDLPDRSLYQGAVSQCVLRTFYEVFKSNDNKHVWGAAINGFVPVSKKLVCIISIFAYRDKFDRTDFAHSEVERALKPLRLLVGGPLSELKPVEPNFHMPNPKKKFVYQKGWVDASAG